MIPRMDEGRGRVDQRNKSETVQMTQIRTEGLTAELMRNLLELESEILTFVLENFSVPSALKVPLSMTPA